jgi:hypothetical protein
LPDGRIEGLLSLEVSAVAGALTACRGHKSKQDSGSAYFVDDCHEMFSLLLTVPLDFKDA